MARIVDPYDPDRYYENAAWVRKPSGSIVVDGREVASTLQCRHCGAHFIYRKTDRYVCVNCGGDICGQRQCVEHCMAIEKKLDLYEKGKLGVLR